MTLNMRETAPVFHWMPVDHLEGPPECQQWWRTSRVKLRVQGLPVASLPNGRAGYCKTVPFITGLEQVHDRLSHLEVCCEIQKCVTIDICSPVYFKKMYIPFIYPIGPPIRHPGWDRIAPSYKALGSLHNARVPWCMKQFPNEGGSCPQASLWEQGMCSEWATSCQCPFNATKVKEQHWLCYTQILIAKLSFCETVRLPYFFHWERTLDKSTQQV